MSWITQKIENVIVKHKLKKEIKRFYKLYDFYEIMIELDFDCFEIETTLEDLSESITDKILYLYG